MDAAQVARCGGSTGPHAAGRRAQRPLPGPRPAARRGAAAVGDRRRRAATSARCASRLGLDSGYLSRLLRSLEAAGWSTVDADERRRARARRAAHRGGLAERAVLDRRSDELAASILEPLNDAPARPARRRDGRGRAAADRRAGQDRGRRPGQRRRAALPARSTSPSSTSRSRPASTRRGASRPATHELRPPAGLFLVATLRGEPVGCGALKFHAERRRPRSSGCGSRRPPRARRRPALLAELETHAAAARRQRGPAGDQPRLTEAIALYRSAGYREVAAVQRRAVRPPLVREAALTVTAADAFACSLPPESWSQVRSSPRTRNNRTSGVRRSRPWRGRARMHRGGVRHDRAPALSGGGDRRGSCRRARLPARGAAAAGVARIERSRRPRPSRGDRAAEARHSRRRRGGRGVGQAARRCRRSGAPDPRDRVSRAAGPEVDGSVGGCASHAAACW